MADSLQELTVPKGAGINSSGVKTNSNGSWGHPERVRFTTTYHWILFLKPITWFFGGLTILIFPTVVGFGEHSYFVLIFGLFIMFFSVLSYLKVHVKLSTSKFSVSGQWLVLEFGLVNKKTYEFLLTNIQSINIYQGLWARAFNYGRITILGTGGSRDVFDHVDRPRELKKHIRHHLNSDRL